MKFLASDPLFKIGDFEVTVNVIIYFAIAIFLIIALISYRYNHRVQTKVSQFMDNECNIYNKAGLEKYIKKQGRKFSNPTVVVVEIRNLNYIYTNYSKRYTLMYHIANELLLGLDKIESVGRIEFNKFVVVYNGKNREEIKEICNKIEDRFDNLILENYGKYNFYLYFGVYENAPLDDAAVLYTAAEITTYSKITDNNIYYYCQEVKDALDLLNRMNTEKDADFEQNRFIPYIQPKVDLTTGRVIGGEVLVRWVDDHQEFKYNPGQFIPLFESNGFVKKIDDLMLHKACGLAQTIVAKGVKDISISVNVSKLKFMSSNFEREIMNIVSQYNISPKNIELEITETTVMENFQYVSNCIMTLRQLGFKVAMDDFGKEFSSLGSLSANPFDTIKLDMVFFKKKLSTEKDRVIVRNILDMLTKLNYHKVCEGVSDKQTLDVLATINQDVIVQGFCISEAIPFSQFEAFVDTKFDFKYPPINGSLVPASQLEAAIKQAEINATIVAATPNNNSQAIPSINISGVGGNPAPEVDNLRHQMEDLRTQLEDQKRKAHEDEMKRLKEEVAKMREKPKEVSSNSEIEQLRRELESLKNNKPAASRSDYRDDEISRLRRELDDIRYNQERSSRYVYPNSFQEPIVYGTNKSNTRDAEYEELQRQIKELKEQQSKQPQIDVNDLIEKLSKSQSESKRYEIEKAQEEAKTLREKLEQERQEKEELENLLNSLNNKDDSEVVSEEDMEKEINAANAKLNLDLTSIGDDDDIDDDDDDIDDDEEDAEIIPSKLSKPVLTLAELEAIIKSYQDKYYDSWNQHAKDELKDGYYDILNGLKYYKDRSKKTFVDKIKKADPEIKKLFNIVKNEIMKYKGVTNKLTNSYDTFYIGRKQIAKITLSPKKIKIFLAADPAKYPERTFPHRDVSGKKAHVRTPYYALLKSQLSVRRINKVIADIMVQNNVTEAEKYRPIDYATKYKFYKSNQK